MESDEETKRQITELAECVAHGLHFFSRANVLLSVLGNRVGVDVSNVLRGPPAEVLAIAPAVAGLSQTPHSQNAHEQARDAAAGPSRRVIQPAPCPSPQFDTAHEDHGDETGGFARLGCMIACRCALGLLPAQMCMPRRIMHADLHVAHAGVVHGEHSPQQAQHGLPEVEPASEDGAPQAEGSSEEEGDDEEEEEDNEDAGIMYFHLTESESACNTCSLTDLTTC